MLGWERADTAACVLGHPEDVGPPLHAIRRPSRDRVSVSTLSLMIQCGFYTRSLVLCVFARGKNPKLYGGCDCGLCCGLGFLEQLGLLLFGELEWEGPPPHLLQVRSWGGGMVSAAFSLALSRADEALA